MIGVMYRSMVLAAGPVLASLVIACGGSSPAGSRNTATPPAAETTGAGLPADTSAAPESATAAGNGSEPASAAAAETPEQAIRRLRGHCKGVAWSSALEILPARGAIHKYHLRDGNKRWLVFVDDTGKSCRVYRVGRAVARLNGAFWDQESDIKAFVLTQPGESDDEYEEWADMVVAVRRQSGQVLDAWETPCNGAHGADLQSFDVFDGRASLMLSCYSWGGAARHQSLYLYHQVAGAMHEVWKGKGSWADPDPSCDKDCPKFCSAHKRYRFKVVRKSGAPPEIESVYPTFIGTTYEDVHQNDEGVVQKPKNKQRWRYDSGKRAFVLVSQSFEQLPLQATCDFHGVMP